MADDMRPENKEELMSLIESEWYKLMEVMGRLSPEQMLTADEGGWSPKDNLAHITSWMNILLGYYFDHRPSYEVVGTDPEVTADWDFDVMNNVIFKRDQNLPVEQVLDELKSTYTRVCDKLETVTFVDLMKPVFEDDPTKWPLLDGVISNTSGHFAEHRETIEKILKA
jgi:hypothetical protein